MPATTPDNLTLDPAGRARWLRTATDRCVKCGLCLAECPTYGLTLNEGESPRGRLALIEALAQGRLALDAGIDRHLDSCLLCQRCERVCPSGVRYAEVMDVARQDTLPQRPRVLRVLIGMLARRRLARLALRLGSWAPAGLPGLLGRLGRLAGSHAGSTPPAPGRYPAATGTDRPAVGLFLGCVGAEVQGHTLHAAIRLLNACGRDVVVPSAQGCCGAMHGHLGDAMRATQHRQRVAQAFQAEGVTEVTGIASGCIAYLTSTAGSHAPVYRDVIDVLLEEPGLQHLSFRHATEKVSWHAPCSQLNVLRSADRVPALLGLIPGLEIRPLAGNTRCCGAAGAYLLSHPETAARLREPKITAAREMSVDTLVTSNPGCLLHLREGLSAQDRAIRVCHPLDLLDHYLVGS